MTDPVRIAMWSGPRNISTAMMRAFASRPDCWVVDEPYYAAFLAESGADHPMRDAVLAAQPTDPAVVTRQLLGPVPGGKALFYQKHMTHHVRPEACAALLPACRHAFLLRAPEAVLASYAAKREAVTLADIGIVQQAALFDAVCAATGRPPPVIDAADVLAAPEPALRALCAALGLDFMPAMLRWPAGPHPRDGVWAPAWYDQVWRSTGFAAPRPVPALPPALAAIADAARPAYARMARHGLRVAA